MTLQHWLQNVVAGVLGALIIFGGAWGFGVFDNEVVVDQEGETTVITGPEGPRGPRGYAGPAGPKGPAGPQGPAGTNANVNIVAIADQVADELEDRAQKIDVTFTGTTGTSTQSFSAPKDGDYKFVLKKIGGGQSGTFYVDVENDGRTVVLINTTGPYGPTLFTRDLKEGNVEINVTSDGSGSEWTVEVEQL